MIYPNNIGKIGHEARLRTLESVWIKGKLKMWGRWAQCRTSPRLTSMYSQLIQQKKLTKTAIASILRNLKKSGCSEEELRFMLEEMMNHENKSCFIFCTDEEGLKMNAVIGEIMHGNDSMMTVLKDHYLGSGKSKNKMAADYHDKNPSISERTHYRRIECCLALSEFMLYRPMSEAFERNPDRYCKKITC